MGPKVFVACLCGAKVSSVYQSSANGSDAIAQLELSTILSSLRSKSPRLRAESLSSSSVRPLRALCSIERYIFSGGSPNDMRSASRMRTRHRQRDRLIVNTLVITPPRRCPNTEAGSRVVGSRRGRDPGLSSHNLIGTCLGQSWTRMWHGELLFSPWIGCPILPCLSTY